MVVIAANWKMNKTIPETIEFAKEFKKIYSEKEGVKAVICAPFTSIYALSKELEGTSIGVGAENLYFETAGAFTGEVSADMLKSAGAEYVLIGHSERREIFGETNEMIKKKLLRALEDGLKPILCCGETLQEREGGMLDAKITRQIESAFDGVSLDDASKVIIAYEPIWAIGTGVVATPDDADEACGLVRSVIDRLYGEDVAANIVIQYGGSMNGGNAAELLAKKNINGGLIGGASLVPEKFLELFAGVPNC
ncbi:triose-phosphate isomerase [Treponema sp. R6D11]